MPQAVEIHALSKEFPVRNRLGLRSGTRRVLDGLDLVLEPGARLGLTGPNGSGKSTLLRILAGVEPPGSGTVQVFGGSLADPAIRRRLGFLPESSPFPAELSAREALELFASLHDLPRAERRARVAQSLERVGLGERAGGPLGRFSKGMLRRFGLAQAFLAEPDLILLDEPTAGLDAEGHVVLAELLEEAKTRGATLILASHQAGDLSRHTERLIVLVDGRVAVDGAPESGWGSEPRVRLELEGLASEDLEALEREVERRGGRVLDRGPATADLLELYRRLSDGEPS